MQRSFKKDYHIRPNTGDRLWGGFGVILLAAAIMLAAVGGTAYIHVSHQKSQSQDNDSSMSQQNDGATNSNNTGVSNGVPDGSGNTDGHRGTGGHSFKASVVAVDTHSITVRTLDDGTTKTYAITTKTTISNAATQSFGNADSGQSDPNGVKVGDVVLVTPDPANATQAVGILINPV